MKTFHPIADTFPLMLGAEYEALKRDIAENGLLEKICLHKDGSIIDGRNRYRACVDVGVEPEFTTWDGDDSELLDYVLSVNLHRRHLTASQRAVMALEVEAKLAELARENQSLAGKMYGRGRDSLSESQNSVKPIKAAEQAAAMFGTNKVYVAKAKKLAAEAPDLLDEVRKGHIGINQATRQMRNKKRDVDDTIFTSTEVADAYNALCSDGIVNVVYLITDGEFYKVGFSSTLLHERVVSLQTGNARKLSVVGVWKGTLKDEDKLHEMLAHLRLEGEWFDLDVIDVLAIQDYFENMEVK
jgi:ParB-like chromosome segregation protein Spo0J